MEQYGDLPAQESVVVGDVPSGDGEAAASKTDVKGFRAKIERARRRRQELASSVWQVNTDYRKVKPFQDESQDDRIAVPVDWSMVKAKQAQLASQVPQIMLTAKHRMFEPAVPVFGKELNEHLTQARLGTAINEVLPDVINAAGIGAVIVGYETRSKVVTTTPVDTTLVPAEAQALMMQETALQTEVPVPMDKRFFVRRISPADLLWPVEFKGSNFDDAPWIGFTGYMTWPEAKAAFGLRDEEKDDVLGRKTKDGQLGDPRTRSAEYVEEVVEYDEIYYWAYLFDEDCMSFHQINRLVFLRGKPDPVVDEPWKGQRPGANGSGYLGACKFPVRVLTLTYISDECIPPSDSEVIRPLVDEEIRFRSQCIAQRDYNRPMRWVDVNRIDPQVLDLIMRGDWQTIYPVQGDGTRVIGEVARSQQMREDYEFSRIIKEDIQSATLQGPNQQAAFNQGERSASEAQIVQANFSTRVGFERQRVTEWICGIAEVMAGLIGLYGDFEIPRVGPDGLQRLASWDKSIIPDKMVYSIRVDSTVLLDSNQRLQKLANFLNMTGKSGFVSVEPILREMAMLSGLDPDLVVKAPQPKGPEPPSVSLKVASEDMRDPLVAAVAMKFGYFPDPQQLEAAKKALMMASTPAQPGPVQGPGGPGGAPNPGGPGGPPQAPGAAGITPQPMVDEKPDWAMLSTINKRRDDGSAF